VTSWRASTSQQAQDDFDDLLNVVLPFAEQTLGRYGEFLPFGAAIGADGRTRLLAADPGLGEHPPSQLVLDSLLSGVRSETDALRAVALVADVRTHDGDAIRIEVEHREGAALMVLVPYRLKRFGKRVTLGEMDVYEADPRIWVER
jgi:hypothetical protein